MKKTLDIIESFQISTEHEIRDELKKLAPKNFEEIPKNLKAEIMAFHFMEATTENESNWGTYFGPEIVWGNEDGSTTESPSIKLVNQEMIDYWKRRLAETNNPLLKARYAGLIWDFSNPVLKAKPDYKILMFRTC